MLKRRHLLSCGLVGLALPGLGLAEPHVAAPGDVVFRLGALDWITRAIVAHSPLPEDAVRRWTHVGVVVASGANPLVAHAMPDIGVHLDRLDAFRSAPAARDFLLLRIEDAELGSRFARAVVRRLGRPFDRRLRWADEEDALYYCTELVLKALLDVGVRLDVPTIRALFYREPIVHPDSLLEAMQHSGLWKN